MKPEHQQESVRAKLESIIAHAKTKTPCADHYNCLLSDLVALSRKSAQASAVCAHCDGTGVEPFETSAYPPEPCSVCKVPAAQPSKDNAPTPDRLPELLERLQATTVDAAISQLDHHFGKDAKIIDALLQERKCNDDR